MKKNKLFLLIILSAGIVFSSELTFDERYEIIKATQSKQETSKLTFDEKYAIIKATKSNEEQITWLNNELKKVEQETKVLTPYEKKMLRIENEKLIILQQQRIDNLKYRMRQEQINYENTQRYNAQEQNRLNEIKRKNKIDTAKAISQPFFDASKKIKKINNNYQMNQQNYQLNQINQNLNKINNSIKYGY